MTDSALRTNDHARAAKESDSDWRSKAVHEAWSRPEKPQAPATPEEKSPERKWTVAVDLTVTMEGDDRKGNVGAQSKMKQLEELAARTRGTGVTIIAQEVQREGDKCSVQRYAIENGEIKKLSKTPSKGTAEDLKDLVSLASHSYPGKQMGLIIQGHGNGDAGIMGDGAGREGSPASISQVDKAITDGLKGAGRSQLDLLSFDSCTMGTEGVLSKVQSVAKQVVASPEVEYGYSGAADGQAMKKAIGDLLDDPKMDASKWADKFVEESKAEANMQPYQWREDLRPQSERSGTPTLTHYDMEKMPQLTSAVDKLGKDLTEYIKDPEHKAALQKIIEASPRYTDFHGDMEDLQSRDLKGFVQNLKTAIADGRISDPTGRLAKDADAVVKAHEQVVRSYYGASSEGKTDFRLDFDKQGGMSIFLPGPSLARAEAQASPIQRLAAATDPEHRKNLTEDQMEMTKMQARNFMEGIKLQVSKISGDKEVVDQYLKKSVEELENAKTLDEFRQKLAQLHKSVLRLQGSRVGAHAQEILKKGFLRPESETLSPGWFRFVEAVQ